MGSENSMKSVDWVKYIDGYMVDLSAYLKIEDAKKIYVTKELAKTFASKADLVQAVENYISGIDFKTKIDSVYINSLIDKNAWCSKEDLENKVTEALNNLGLNKYLNKNEYNIDKTARDTKIEEIGNKIAQVVLDIGNIKAKTDNIPNGGYDLSGYVTTGKHDADLGNVYNKQEIDAKLIQIVDPSGNIQLNGYVETGEFNNKYNDLNTRINQNKKSIEDNKEELERNFYKKGSSDIPFITKDEVTNKENVLKQNISDLENKVTVLENKPEGISEAKADGKYALKSSLETNYNTKVEISNTLEGYLKKTDAGNLYITENALNDKLNEAITDKAITEDKLNEKVYSKIESDNKFATKDSVEGMVKQPDIEGFIKLDALTPYAKKTDLNTLATKNELGTLATKEEIKDFINKTEVAKDYVTKAKANQDKEQIIGTINLINGKVTDLENNSLTEASAKVLFDTKQEAADKYLVKAKEVEITGKITEVQEALDTFKGTVYTKEQTFTKDEVKEEIDKKVTGGQVDLSAYYKKTETYSKEESDNKFALKGEAGNVNLDNYYNKAQTEEKFYTKEQSDEKYALKGATGNQDHSGYVLKSELTNNINTVVDPKIEPLATKESLNEYTKTTDLNGIIEPKVTEVLGTKNYATETFVTEKLKTIPAIDAYTKEEADNKFALDITTTRGFGQTTEKFGYLGHFLNGYVDLTIGVGNPPKTLQQVLQENGGNTDLTNYYTKEQTYNKEEVNQLVGEKVSTTDFDTHKENVFSKEETRIAIKKAGIGVITPETINSYLVGYQRANSDITLDALDKRYPSKTTIDIELETLKNRTNNLYTKEEINNQFVQKSHAWTMDAFNARMSDLDSRKIDKRDVESSYVKDSEFNNKFTSAASYYTYGKSDLDYKFQNTYTKQEVDKKIATLSNPSGSVVLDGYLTRDSLNDALKPINQSLDNLRANYITEYEIGTKFVRLSVYRELMDNFMREMRYTVDNKFLNAPNYAYLNNNFAPLSSIGFLENRIKENARQLGYQYEIVKNYYEESRRKIDATMSRSEIENLINSSLTGEVSLVNYYNKDEIDRKLGLLPNTQNLKDTFITRNELYQNYYTKSEIYSSNERIYRDFVSRNTVLDLIRRAKLPQEQGGMNLNDEVFLKKEEAKYSYMPRDEIYDFIRKSELNDYLNRTIYDIDNYKKVTQGLKDYFSDYIDTNNRYEVSFKGTFNSNLEESFNKMKQNLHAETDARYITKEQANSLYVLKGQAQDPEGKDIIAYSRIDADGRFALKTDHADSVKLIRDEIKDKVDSVVTKYTEVNKAYNQLTKLTTGLFDPDADPSDIDPLTTKLNSEYIRKTDLSNTTFTKDEIGQRFVTLEQFQKTIAAKNYPAYEQSSVTTFLGAHILPGVHSITPIDQIYMTRIDADGKFVTKDTYNTDSANLEKLKAVLQFVGPKVADFRQDNLPSMPTIDQTFLSLEKAEEVYAKKSDIAPIDPYYSKVDSDGKFLSKEQAEQDYVKKENLNNEVNNITSQNRYDIDELKRKSEKYDIALKDIAYNSATPTVPIKELMYTKQEVDAKFALKNTGPNGEPLESYTKADSDRRYAKNDEFSKIKDKVETLSIDNVNLTVLRHIFKNYLNIDIPNTKEDILSELGGVNVTEYRIVIRASKGGDTGAALRYLRIKPKDDNYFLPYYISYRDTLHPKGLLITNDNYQDDYNNIPILSGTVGLEAYPFIEIECSNRNSLTENDPMGIIGQKYQDRYFLGSGDTTEISYRIITNKEIESIDIVAGMEGTEFWSKDLSVDIYKNHVKASTVSINNMTKEEALKVHSIYKDPISYLEMNKKEHAPVSRRKNIFNYYLSSDFGNTKTNVDIKRLTMSTDDKEYVLNSFKKVSDTMYKVVVVPKELTAEASEYPTLESVKQANYDHDVSTITRGYNNGYIAGEVMFNNFTGDTDDVLRVLLGSKSTDDGIVRFNKKETNITVTLYDDNNKFVKGSVVSGTENFIKYFTFSVIAGNNVHFGGTHEYRTETLKEIEEYSYTNYPSV